MKRVVIIILPLLFLRIGTAFPQPLEMHKFEHGVHIPHIVVHPDRPNVIYAGSVNNGLFQSPDGGKSWSRAFDGMKNTLLYAITVHPEKPEVIYAGSWGGGVYLSKNGGEAWHEANRGLTNTAVGALAFSPKNSSVMVAATSRAIFRSDDAGQSWREWGMRKDFLADPGMQPYALTILPDQGETALLGTVDGVWKRAINDKQWTRLGLQGVTISAVNYDARTSRIWAGGDGLSYSEDQGRTWTAVDDPDVKMSWVRAIAFHPANPVIIAVGTSGKGLFLSVDGGKSWTRSVWEGANHDIRGLLFSLADSDLLLVGAYGDTLQHFHLKKRNWEAISLPVLGVEELKTTVADAVTRAARAEQQPPPPPTYFRKCNDCHGWAIPQLDAHHASTYWRTTPSRRNWKETMAVMGPRARMSRWEQWWTTRYLNKYYGLE